MAKESAVDETLRALAHPARRAMLQLVWDAERSSSDLADAVGMSRPAASQHLKVLREAGLVHVRVDGNQRLDRVDLERLSAVRSQLEGFWGARLGRLAAEVAHQRRRRGAEGSGEPQGGGA
jgi:DNA-binding transcriptional ArsR family regulator